MLASRCDNIINNITYGNNNNVQLLLDYSADVNISSSPTGGDSALSLACEGNDRQLAQVLIKNAEQMLTM